ncbi:MAG: class I SAM-dependent methyltransferase [Thermoplasmata archaeon]|nr:class I SAM-dependent methyltransferase [Thermoplasmata archaeon]
MAIDNHEVIKKIICANFDDSSESYDRFEARYGLFRYLARELSSICNVSKGMSICDIGCGSGASTTALGELVGEHGKVVGVDFSREMLKAAEENARGGGNIEYLLGDACDLEGKVEEEAFDSVLYNASIFLIPDTKAALTTAHGLLEKEGIVGMNYQNGVFKDREAAGEMTWDDIFTEAKKAGIEYAPYGRSLMNPGQLPEIMDDIGFKDLRSGIMVREMQLEEMKEFYSIPAQSAGLYPKTPYEERLELLDSLISDLRKDGVTTVYQVWGWISGLK